MDLVVYESSKGFQSENQRKIDNKDQWVETLKQVEAPDGRHYVYIPYSFLKWPFYLSKVTIDKIIAISRQFKDFYSVEDLTQLVASFKKMEEGSRNSWWTKIIHFFRGMGFVTTKELVQEEGKKWDLQLGFQKTQKGLSHLRSPIQRLADSKILSKSYQDFLKKREKEWDDLKGTCIASDLHAFADKLQADMERLKELERQTEKFEQLHRFFNNKQPAVASYLKEEASKFICNSIQKADLQRVLDGFSEQFHQIESLSEEFKTASSSFTKVYDGLKGWSTSAPRQIVLQYRMRLEGIFLRFLASDDKKDLEEGRKLIAALRARQAKMETEQQIEPIETMASLISKELF
jgi:hypothetical protein